MMIFRNCILVTLLSSAQASFTQIAGFEPESNVNDHLAIDLDQQAMEEQLGFLTTDSFAAAQKIYESGGNSKSYAVLRVDSLVVSANEGDSLVGKTESTSSTYGSPMESATTGATELKVLYTVSEDMKNYVNCRVGGLTNPITEGCLNTTGELIQSGASTPVQYSYDPLTDNMNGRTLKYFSTTADTKMRKGGTGAFYADFQKFVTYYGSATYADDFIMAAFNKASASFTNGDFNFASMDFDARAEAIKKGTAYMSASMYAIREMEDALDQCDEGCKDNTCVDDPDNSLDEGVAFYTGSLEGADGSGTGVMFYSLADKRCINFKTCGEKADETSGLSKVNSNIFQQFNLFQSNWSAKKCDDARKNKEAIVKQMIVPLVQGTIRYAYLAENDYTAKGEAEGATFAAAVLPWIHNCSASSAKTIYDNMKPGSGSGKKLSLVKSAFQSTYGCLGITGADVGGVYDDTTKAYVADGAPSASAGSMVVVSFIGLVGSLVTALVTML